jgi:hypothetical protein
MTARLCGTSVSAVQRIKAMMKRAGVVTATLSTRLEGQTRRASCRCDGILPLRGSFGSEDP